ncbi:carboxylesterase family protein [Arthrobacter sp. AL12]|uniref:carboxylesterase/lipase family protein n=1 Tax=Arthrobacter sp. AL12 TaxID=3042241 RepID=UPI00249CCB3F|nr:carboxylesterase family protein [Arthrobacter sp. AL12]MDI3211453.1 carboxylesterase family protein [Arthrobacter sp. AL12]
MARLRPPEPVEPWRGVRDATRLGPEPAQVAPPSTGGPDQGAAEDWTEVTSAFAAVERAAPSGDCLNLNVWTPDPGASGLPVMVWIEGGMFELSSTAAYDGSRFARDGVVCIVINWRSGAEGFLYLGDGIANLGLLDHLAALQWVRENIAAFGGDPGNVTVFGESAGATSIGMLLSMPRAVGLFRRAILQSGAAHQVTPAADALRIAGYLAGKLGVPRTRAAIVGAGVERLLAAQAELKAELMEKIAAGSGGSVDLIVGTNADDWRLWLVASGAIGGITDEILSGPVRSYGHQPLQAFGLIAGQALPAYRERYPTAAPGELLAVVQPDWWMRIPAIRLADAHASAAAGTYMYEFHWASPGPGAVHALEIPFVLDTATPDAPLFGPMLGEDPPQGLAQTMHAAWVAFARTGDPGWPRYEPGRRATMRFDTVSRVAEDPRAWERALWTGTR